MQSFLGSIGSSMLKIHTNPLYRTRWLYNAVGNSTREGFLILEEKISSIVDRRWPIERLSVANSHTLITIDRTKWSVVSIVSKSIRIRSNFHSYEAAFHKEAPCQRVSPWCIAFIKTAAWTRFPKEKFSKLSCFDLTKSWCCLMFSFETSSLRFKDLNRTSPF